MTTAISRHAPAAFTMTEMLFGIGILAVGLMSAAALVPVGGTLQRQSYEEMTTAVMTSNAEALITAKGITRTGVPTGAALANFTEYNDKTKGALTIDYMPSERTLATHDPVGKVSPGISHGDLDKRPFEFIFTGRTSTTTGPEVYVFICRRTDIGNLTPVEISVNAPTGSSRVFTSVPSATARFRPGAFTIDAAGNIYQVVNSIDGNGGSPGTIEVDRVPPAGTNKLWAAENGVAPNVTPVRILRILRFGTEVMR